jgi:hypothetical protein
LWIGHWSSFDVDDAVKMIRRLWSRLKEAMDWYRVRRGLRIREVDDEGDNY